MKYLKKFESPDCVITNPKAKYEQDKNIVTYKTGDAIPFAFMLYSNEAKCGDYGAFHGQDVNIDLSNDRKFKLPGRLWVEHKVISFWLYPHPEEFVELMENLEEEINNKYKELDIKFFNDGWKIEVVKVNNDIKTIGKYDTEDLYTDVRSYLLKFEDVLIPIEEYTGSEDQPEELKAIHLMNAKEREEYYKKHGKPKGFGSDYYTDKLPKGMSDAQYKDTKTKYRFTESFDDYKRKI